MAITHHHVQAQNIRLHYVEAKPEMLVRPLKTLIFLHGFPEYWATWQHQIERFCTEYRVIVPDLMGYNLSEKPTDVDAYRLPKLIELFATFVAKVSPDQQVVLVAHDWGGAIAWPLVAFHRELFSRLIILNAAHPSTFTREMKHNPLQRQKSAYIHQLIAADAIKVVSHGNFAMLQKMLFHGMCETEFSGLQQAAYLQAWRQPGALNGMLQYYRAMPQLAPAPGDDDGIGREPQSGLKIPTIRIQIPTLVLWGERDDAFVNDILNGLEEYVPDCQIHRFKKATHWLHHEQPALVNSYIADFIKDKA